MSCPLPPLPEPAASREITATEEVAVWRIDTSRPVLATAVHAGTGLRPEVASSLALADHDRRREEDVATGRIAAGVGSYVVATRSRFEVDLNRPRSESVYLGPEDAWGLQVWRETPKPGLVARSRNLHTRFYERLSLSLDALVALHGGFVLYDVHSYNHRQDGPAQPALLPSVAPTVNLGTGSLPRRWQGVAEEFLLSVSAEIEWLCHRWPGERQVRGKTCHPMGSRPLWGVELCSGDRVQEGLHGRVERRDRPPRSGQTQTSLGRDCAPYVESPSAMSVSPGDLAVDRELAEIAGMLPWLRLVTPTNVAEQRALFEISPGEPEFSYADLPDLGAIATRLDAVDTEAVADPAVRHFALGKRRELLGVVDLLSSRGTNGFFLAAVGIWGNVEDSLVELALAILAEPADHSGAREMVTAIAVADAARSAIEDYRLQYPELVAEVHVADDVTGIRVERGHVFIGTDLRMEARRMPSLIAHEVGVHVLTFANGSAQPLLLLAAGLAGYDECQEALGLLAEFLTGNLDRGRMRVLAYRVLAARLCSERSSFVETYDYLRGLGAGRGLAFTTTMRAHRGGGLTKDAVYLRGIVRLLEYLRADRSLETLLVGKLSLEDEALVTDLLDRGVLMSPPLRPRFLDEDLGRQRLASTRRGLTVGELLGGGPEVTQRQVT